MPDIESVHEPIIRCRNSRGSRLREGAFPPMHDRDWQVFTKHFPVCPRKCLSSRICSTNVMPNQDIQRTQERKRVWWGRRVSVGEDLGGRRKIKKKKQRRRQK